MVDRVSKHSVARAKASTAPQPARPFQCKWHQGCSKSFNRKSDLQRHYRIHTNERPYACDYKPCEKTFIQRSALTVHRRTHTGDKPHKCPFVGCGKCFSDSSSLARHRRIHTNDKPYICKNQQCRKAFCRKTTMTKHFRKEHSTDAVDRDDDLESSEVEQSDEEPSLEQDAEDSPEEDQESSQERDVKAEMSQGQGAGNYNANLWRLPAQSAQQPSQNFNPSFDLHAEISAQSVKLERSLSRTPQRTLTDPYVNTQGSSEYIPTRANTIPDPISIPVRLSQVPNGGMRYKAEGESQVPLWHSPRPMDESPTSMPNSSPGLDQTQRSFACDLYQLQDMNIPTSAPASYPQEPVAMMRQPSLQIIHDIILDEPQDPQYNNLSRPQTQQQTYTTVPQAQPTYVQHHQVQGNPGQDYGEEMPPTPGPSPHDHYTAFMNEASFEATQFAPSLPTYRLPTNGAFPNPIDPSKPLWDDYYKDGWTQLPNQRLTWHH